MNRTELIAALAQHASLSEEAARHAIDGLFGARQQSGVIAAALRRRERVQLSGFGTFEARERPQRLGRNPHTNESMVIPAGVGAVFRAAGALKAHLR